jgi:hypothetical protein
MAETLEKKGVALLGKEKRGDFEMHECSHFGEHLNGRFSKVTEI